MKLSQKDLNRFWKKIRKQGPDDCWPWLAGKTKFGHGVFSIKQKWISAHRVSFFIANGYLPDIKNQRLVMHDCENPECQNPNHLLDGTAQLNGNYPGCVKKLKNKTGIWKGKYGKHHTARWGKKHSSETKKMLSEKAIQRGGWHKGLKRSKKTRERISEVTRGENSPHAILTDEKVKCILLSNKKNIELAKHYGIDPSVISGIRRRVKWKHVKI